MDMQKVSLSVFLPTYNEEENIDEVVTNIDNYLKFRFGDYEILVINDGSKDKTAEVVRKLQTKIKNLRLIEHPKNLGYAQALRTGFQNAGKELVFYTDSDGQFDINELDKLLPLLEDYDVVTGYRIKRQDPMMRIWMGRVYNWAMRLLFGLKLKDIDCAFKLYKRKIFDHIQLRNDISTGVLNLEVFLKATNAGYKISEVGVNHYRRMKGVATNEIGKGGKFFAFVKPGVIMKFLSDTIKLWKEIKYQTQR